MSANSALGESSSLFVSQQAGNAFQKRADAIFGALPSAKLPEKIPVDLRRKDEELSEGQSTTEEDRPVARRAEGRGFFLAKKHGKSRSGDRDTDSHSERMFKRPLGRPPPAKKSRGYRAPDHVLHPERYTK